MVAAGDYREPIAALFSDLTERLIDIQHQHVIVGGDFNCKTHREAFNQLLIDTGFIDVAQYFQNTQPTFKRSLQPLDKVLASQTAISMVRAYNVMDYDVLCKSDHAAMVVDLKWAETYSPVQLKERILSSKNQKNVRKFLDIVLK